MVRILAVETSHKLGDLAAFHGGACIAHRPLPPEKKTTAAFATELEALLREAGWKPDDVAGIAVGIGPGSFTGVRIGIVLAKAFAYAAGAQVVGIDSRDGLAATIGPQKAGLCVLVDAQRGDVVGRRYRWNTQAEQWDAVEDIPLTPFSHVLVSLANDETIACPSAERFQKRDTRGLNWLPAEAARPSAVGVGRLAVPRFAAGDVDSLWTLAPLYHRPSAAEEKRMGDSS
ncbi:tRNA (adenosine(37)-N6)-threonylcarbamoyltransferase complex dimerization subunit type 1 TsaB [Thermostilla marina]